MSYADHLRERVRIERPVDIRDTFGGVETRSWELVGEYFAQVQARSARQVAVAGQKDAQAVYHIMLRAPVAVGSEMRLLWRGRVLAIDSIMPDIHTTELTCHEEAL